MHSRKPSIFILVCFCPETLRSTRFFSLIEIEVMKERILACLFDRSVHPLCCWWKILVVHVCLAEVPENSGSISAPVDAPLCPPHADKLVPDSYNYLIRRPVCSHEALGCNPVSFHELRKVSLGEGNDGNKGAVQRW